MKQPRISLPVILPLLAVVFSLRPAVAEEAPVAHKRLVIVCANLSNAATLAAGGIATSVDDESKRAAPLFNAALRQKIFKLVDAITASVASSSPVSRPDIFAYARDARLALIDNRKEPFDGHRQYIIDHPKKAQEAITRSVEDIKRTMMQLKI